MSYNWGVYALDLDSKQCDGVITNHLGVELSIQDNWLRMSWTSGMFHPPIVGTMTEGDVNFGGWHVLARQCPGAGVHVVAYSARYDASLGGGDASYVDRALLVGCGINIDTPDVLAIKFLKSVVAEVVTKDNAQTWVAAALDGLMWGQQVLHSQDDEPDHFGPLRDILRRGEW